MSSYKILKNDKVIKKFKDELSSILDEHLQNVVTMENINISLDILWQAGFIVESKQYDIFKERKYPGIMLGSSATGLHHFKEMVDSKMHITIKWSTADELIKLNPPVIRKIFDPADSAGGAN